MNMAELEFFKGPYDNLAKVPIKEGQLLFTTGDKKRILLDIDNKTRAEIASSMIVTFTMTDPTTFALKADTPYADIVEAANAGRIVYAFVPAPGPLFGQLSNVNGSTLYFNGLSGGGNGVINIRMESDSVIHWSAGVTLRRPDDSVGGGDFDAYHYKIVNIKEPTAPNDVATKGYVDKSLVAETEPFVVTVTTDDNADMKSDKTPAEIKAALEAGKQIVLHNVYADNSIDTGLLMSVDNDMASFCLINSSQDENVDYLPFSQSLIFIFSDKTVGESMSLNVPLFIISTNDSGKYVSGLSPEQALSAAQMGCGGNVFLNKDGKILFGTISYDTEQDELHIYFQDYSKDKVYDLKWNGEENPPFTYTFTELGGTATKDYVDNSTPTFIYLKEQNGVIQSQTTDINMLSNVLINQTLGYALKQNPLYKAIKCYAVLDGNCYDLVYSSLEDTQEPGKSSIVKGTFYAVTSDGLNKLSVLIDENDKVTWTKEAQGVASEQFVVTVTNVGEHNTWESDKTPAEIAASSQAGKQVVLKRQWQSKTETAYLVSVTDERADFCFIGSDTNTDLEQDFPISGDMFEQEWVTITADKAAKIHREAHSPVFVIQKVGDDCASAVSPYNFLNASLWGPASNVYLFEDGEILSGVVVQTSEENSTSYFHIYFPNYARNKLYDLKWNKDENPSTYTFTELTLDEKPMVVAFTITDPTTFALKADTPYADIVEAADAGRIVYAFVPERGLFGQLSYSSGSGIRFNSFSGIGEVMSIVMNSDSDITGTLINMIYRPGNIVGGGDFDAKYNGIANVKEPINASDAATKGYADNILTAGNNDSVVIKSSTPNSTKKFRITVNDAGAISATEIQ